MTAKENVTEDVRLLRRRKAEKLSRIGGEIVTVEEILEKINNLFNETRTAPFQPLINLENLRKDVLAVVGAQRAQLKKLLNEYPLHTIEFYKKYPVQVKKEHIEWKKRLEKLGK